MARWDTSSSNTPHIRGHHGVIATCQYVAMASASIPGARWPSASSDTTRRGSGRPSHTIREILLQRLWCYRGQGLQLDLQARLRPGRSGVQEVRCPSALRYQCQQELHVHVIEQGRT